jgi:hypothetical protein
MMEEKASQLGILTTSARKRALFGRMEPFESIVAIRQ